MDRLRSGRQLGRGTELVAGNGRTRLAMQADGNLVLYRVDDGHALWASGTSQPASRAVPSVRRASCGCQCACV